MIKPIQVSVSILCADFVRLADEVKKIEKSGADRIHVDVMDGHFVPPVTVGDLVVRAIRPLTKLPIDAHLMVEHPETMIKDFAEAGADSIAVHVECYGDLKPQCRRFGEFPKELEKLDLLRAKQNIEQIKDLGKEAVMVINPGTSIELLDPLLPELDGVLVMSVNPGFASQKFIPEALRKLQYLSERFQEDIAVDGGINAMTGAQAVKAGATILATASHFFHAEDQAGCIKQLKSGGV